MCFDAGRQFATTCGVQGVKPAVPWLARGCVHHL